MKHLLALLLLAPLCHADTFKLGGTITATFDGGVEYIGQTAVSLAGQGITVKGWSTVNGDCGFCTTGGLPGQSFMPTGSLTLNNVSLSLRGVVQQGVEIWGAVQILGNPFLLPVTTTTDLFSVTLPISITGSFLTSNGDTLVFPSGGHVTITYQQVDGHWEWQSATYTMTPVPEPDTLLLIGSGLIGIGYLVRRGHIPLPAAKNSLQYPTGNLFPLR